MNKVVLMRRGEDDFGREIIKLPKYKYSQHAPRVKKGDLMLYWDKKDQTLGMYTVDDETEYYYKDGFQYCEGTMTRFDGGDTVKFHETLIARDPKLAAEFEKVVNKVAAEM